MPDKKGLVDGDVLDGDNPLFALQFQNAVDQQERVSVRQNFKDFVDIEADFRFLAAKARARSCSQS